MIAGPSVLTKEWQTLLRMSLDFSLWQSAILTLTVASRARQRTDSDLPLLVRCYQHNPECTFSPDLFASAIYAGIYEEEHIVAAAGTRILDATHQIAVLGNIFTLPEARKNGYATVITATLISILIQQNYSTIVLNVFEDNDAAVRIYQRLGFRTRHTLPTGKAVLTIQQNHL